MRKKGECGSFPRIGSKGDPKPGGGKGFGRGMGRRNQGRS